MSESSPGATVSVVVIFRDAARYLAEAIESVYAQSYTDWELILVDDGGRDGSDAIATDYVRRNPARIRYLSHEGRVNRGTAQSRNLGIENACGRYIAELDADDVWRPDFLHRRVSVLERDPAAAFAFGPVLRWYSWSGSPGDEARDWIARPWDELGPVIEAPALLPILLEKPQLGGVPKGWVMRRAAILSVGGYPPWFRDVYEDQALLCMVGLTGRALYLRECDYLYRRHPASLVTEFYRTEDRRQTRSRFLQWLERYLNEAECEDVAVRRSLRLELRRCHYPRMTRIQEELVKLPERVVRKLTRYSVGRPAERA